MIVIDISIATHGDLKFTPLLEVFQSIYLKVLKIGQALIINIPLDTDNIPLDTGTWLHKIHVDISLPVQSFILDFYRMCPMLQDLRIEGRIVKLLQRNQTFLVIYVSHNKLVIKLILILSNFIKEEIFIMDKMSTMLLWICINFVLIHQD